jgi:hypothetical protein
MFSKSIHVVTFNPNEANAARDLLDSIAAGRIWKAHSPRDEPFFIEDTRGNRIKHVDLGAQGNVNSAKYVMNFYTAHRSGDNLLFFGCCGATAHEDLGKAFLVRNVSYMALGSVRLFSRKPKTRVAVRDVFKSKDGKVQLVDAELEVVSLSNKWFTETDSSDGPLPNAACRYVLDGYPIEICKITGISAADVVSTENVIKRHPGDVHPLPVTKTEYEAGGWTFGQSLNYFLSNQGSGSNEDVPLLIDMESYGVLTATEALSLSENVLILRITTDGLADHGRSKQRQILLDGRVALCRILIALLSPFDGSITPLVPDNHATLNTMENETPLDHLLSHMDDGEHLRARELELFYPFLERQQSFQIKTFVELISRSESSGFSKYDSGADGELRSQPYRFPAARTAARRFINQIVTDAKMIGLDDDVLIEVQDWSRPTELTPYALFGSLLCSLVVASEMTARKRQTLGTGIPPEVLIASLRVRWRDAGLVLGLMAQDLSTRRVDGDGIDELVRQISDTLSTTPDDRLREWVGRTILEGRTRLKELFGIGN